MKKIIVFGIALLFLGAGFFFFHHAQKETSFSDVPSPQLYSYEISAQGGTGPQLQIISKWEGKITADFEGNSLLLRPEQTKISLQVNGGDRKDLVAQVIAPYEKVFRANRDPATGFLIGLDWQVPSPPLAQGLDVMVENQLRQMAHLFLLPSPRAGVVKVTAPCLLGACDYRFDHVTKDHYEIFRAAARDAMPLQARYEVTRDDLGIVSISGREDTPDDDPLASSHMTVKIMRLDDNGSILFWPKEATRSIPAAAGEISDADKRAAVSSQLQGVTLEGLLRLGQGLPKDSGKWGEIFVQLRDLLWLHPEMMPQLVAAMEKLKPDDRMFFTAMNALVAQENTASQDAMRSLLDHYSQQPDVAGSLLIAYARTPNPTPATQNYFLQQSQWNKPDSNDPSVKAARLMSGVVANHLGNTKEAAALVAPALATAAQDPTDQNADDRIAALNTIGNSGLPDGQAVIDKILENEDDPEVRSSALMAMRFIPGAEVTDRLFETAQDAEDPDDAKAARSALEMRCKFLPAECGPDVQKLFEN